MKVTLTDLPDKRQLAIWKKMSYEEKYQLLNSLLYQAREFKRLGLKMKHPNDSEEEIGRKTALAFLYAST